MWIIRNVRLHVCFDDAIISALGIGGITCNSSLIARQADRKSGQWPSNQVKSVFLVHLPGSQTFRQLVCTQLTNGTDSTVTQLAKHSQYKSDQADKSSIVEI